MEKLAESLFREDRWEIRGEKTYKMCGLWNELGKIVPERDCIHLCGKGGKHGVSKELNDQLIDLGNAASDMLRYYRPDVTNVLQRREYPKMYGLFHIFMCSQGPSILRQDENDFISVLFLIRSAVRGKAGLEIGDLDLVFSWQPGDMIILDSDILWHGTRDWHKDLAKEDHLVGIFLVHRSFLYLHHFQSHELKREIYSQQTIPPRIRDSCQPPPHKVQKKTGGGEEKIEDGRENKKSE